METLLRLPEVGVLLSRSELVYQGLRVAITDGALPPGYRLREVPIARHYGVSTTPVREALRRLEREGIVQISAHRGALVPTIEAGVIAQLYDAREVLEAAAVRRAAQATARDLSRAEALLERGGAVARDADSAPFLRLDLEFHRALNEVGGNLILVELAEGVHRRIQGIRVSLSVYFPGRPAVAHQHHRELVAAVRAGDADEAERVARAHVRSIGALVQAAIAGPDVDADGARARGVTRSPGPTERISRIGSS